MAATALHPIFRDCCGSDTARHNLSKPFGIAECVYATDGAICVRSRIAWPSVESTPDADKLGWSDRGGKWSQIPDRAWWDGAGWADCDACDGAGHLVRDYCFACDIEFPDPDNKCEICNGTEWMPVDPDPGRRCPKCIGNGVLFSAEDVVQFDGITVSAKYAYLLARHGITSVQLPIVGKSRLNNPIYFRGDGFEGLMMARRPCDQDRVLNASTPEAANG